jgi:hypothetical protein
MEGERVRVRPRSSHSTVSVPCACAGLLTRSTAPHTPARLVPTMHRTALASPLAGTALPPRRQAGPHVQPLTAPLGARRAASARPSRGPRPAPPARRAPLAAAGGSLTSAGGGMREARGCVWGEDGREREGALAQP